MEEKWHDIFLQYPILLEQLIAQPVVVVKDKAYLGGKNICNQKGSIADFLLENRLTKTAAIVEIKTPRTPLMGAPYRGTYGASAPLSGAIGQLLKYRKDFVSSWTSLRVSGYAPEVADPPCLLIIGRVSDLKKEQMDAFELYRQQLRSVTVVTFDEVFMRARRLREMMG